jgi:endonuclease III
MRRPGAGTSGRKRTPPRGAGGGAAATKAEEISRRLRVLDGLARAYPDARCALVFSNPLECLVATVLSAQCTDVRVNLVTRDLFKEFRSAADYAGAPRELLEDRIRSTGFFRSKAKSIQGLCAALVKDHGGVVPASMEALVALPGVGRKTANLVLGESFGIASGIVVDTHVQRLSGRLALTRHDDPVKIENDLMQIVPREDWIAFGTRMIAHGRRTCQARKPQCGSCTLLADCPFGLRQAAASSKETAPKRRLKKAAPRGRPRGRR